MLPLRLATVCAIAAIPLASVVWAVAAAPAAPAPHPLAQWTHFELEGRKFLVGSAKASLDRWPEQAGAPELVQVISRAGVFGSGSERITTIERETASANQWRSFSLVPKEKARVTRATSARCVVSTRFDPHKRALDADPSRWKPRSPERYMATDSTLPLLEPYLLLAHLDRWLDGKTTKIAIAGREKVTLATVRLGAERTGEITMRDTTTGKTQRLVSHQRQVMLEPEHPEDEALLSLIGPVSIWVDRDTGLPVEVEGRHEKVGSIRMTLSVAWQSPVPRPQRQWPATPAADVLCPPVPGG